MKSNDEIVDEWKEVERESKGYVAWDNEGKMLVGKLVRIEDGAKGGKVAVFEIEGQMTKCACPTILFEKLQGMEGKQVKVIYSGAIKFSNGRFGKDFKVYSKGKPREPDFVERMTGQKRDLNSEVGAFL